MYFHHRLAHAASSAVCVLNSCRAHRRPYVALVVLGLFLIGLGAPATGAAAPGSRPTKADATRWAVHIDKLLAQMTLTEKIGQLTLFATDWNLTGPTVNKKFRDYIADGRCGAIFNAYGAQCVNDLQKLALEKSRLQIPVLMGYDVIHGFRTIFPIPLAEACSWDLPAIERSARIAAAEAAAEGVHWTFAPMVDIARDPRWGRVSEGSGEDVFLGSLIAAARVRGFQGADLTNPASVLACAKHFAAYGAPEAGRDYNVVDLSPRTLEEVYLPPYRACVDAGVRTFMTAFNEINGVPCTGNRELLTTLLRRDWGFRGFIVTDYTSITEMIAHGVAADGKDAAALALNAGVDMDMQGGLFLEHLAELVKNGRVSIHDIDAAVRRILWAKAELGLFDDPFRQVTLQREQEMREVPLHLAAAHDMAVKSMVLLQNTDNVLPLSRQLHRVAIIGPLATATTDLLGNWHAAGDGSKVVPLTAAIRALLPSSTVVEVVPGLPGVNSTDSRGIAAAVAAARSADAVILVLGEHETMSGEAASRADIDLPGAQNELAEAVATAVAARNRGQAADDDATIARATPVPLAAVLFNGRPLAISRLQRAVPAILEAWFPGTCGGKAVADVLFGRAAPTGKLTMTFPRCVGQVPIHYDCKNTGRPIVGNEKYTSRYLDVPNTPLFPFGWGLTYTTFAYGDLRVLTPRVGARDRITVTVTVKNTGIRDGEEVVQLYTRQRVGTVTRPLAQLRAFQKIAIPAGAQRKVVFHVPARVLEYRRADGTIGVDTGVYDFMVGGNSTEVATATVTLIGTAH